MVYRLHRASKFLRIRIFAVLLIYALIIGFVGLFLLNFVVLFDTQSFTPQLIDVNDTNLAEKREELAPDPLCENYKSEDCQWLLFDDFLNTTGFEAEIRDNPFLSQLRRSFSNKELLLVQEKPNNFIKLVRAKLFVYTVFDTTYDNQSLSISTPISFQNFGACFSLELGELCKESQVDSFNLELEPNLKLYTNLSSGQSFIAGQVLIDNSNNKILCDNISPECEYFPAENLSSQLYTYFNLNTEKNENISARQSLIKPYTEISEVPPGDITGKQLSEICVINTDSCDTGSINYNEPYIDENFIFIQPSTNFFWVGGIELWSATSGNELIYPLNKQTQESSFFECRITHSRGESTEFKIQGNLNVDCTTGYAGDNTNSGNSFSLIKQPLVNNEEFPATDNTKIVFAYDFEQNRIFVNFITFSLSTENKSSFEIIVNIATKPNVFIKQFFVNDITSFFLPFIIGFFIVNLLFAFLLITIRFWKKIGGFFGSRIPLLLRGKTGKLLELTQFFEFSGQWYLEIHGVTDYNFKSTRGVVHELVNERWRDTIFFPTALAASISIVIFSINADPVSLIALFVIAGIMPFLLSFWVPTIWVMQDSGLKRVEWSKSGELLQIEKVSKNLRDGFNKLVGFGAIFGIGTAGAALARSKISGSSVSSLTAFTGGVESLLLLNWNFLISALLWTITLLFLITAVSMVGNTMTSLSYLNSGHLENVKRVRVKLQEKEIFLGTTQQSMDHTGKDISVYYDSKTGINELYKATARGLVAPVKKLTEDELTKLEVEEPHQDELFTEDNSASESSSENDSDDTDSVSDLESPIDESSSNKDSEYHDDSSNTISSNDEDEYQD